MALYNELLAAAARRRRLAAARQPAPRSVAALPPSPARTARQRHGAIAVWHRARRAARGTRKRAAVPAGVHRLMLDTIAVLWWNIPVINILTGGAKHTAPRSAQFVENIIRPSLAGCGVQRPAADPRAAARGWTTCRRSAAKTPAPLGQRDGGGDGLRHQAGPHPQHPARQLGGAVHERRGPGARQAGAHLPTAGCSAREETVEHLLGLDADFYVTIKFEGLAR